MRIMVYYLRGILRVPLFGGCPPPNKITGPSIGGGELDSLAEAALSVEMLQLGSTGTEGAYLASD